MGGPYVPGIMSGSTSVRPPVSSRFRIYRNMLRLLIALCCIALIWSSGFYFSSTASSDPAGQGYAEIIPIVLALIISVPFGIVVARVPISETARHRRIRRALYCAPLALASTPVILGLVGLVLLVAIEFLVTPVGALLMAVVGIAVVTIWFVRRHRGRHPSPPTKTARPTQKRAADPKPIQPRPVKPPRIRTRKARCGIWAWVLPVLAVPIGLLLGYVAGQKDYQGFDGLEVLAWLFLPLLVALCISPILAIIALCRREKYPWLSILLLVPYCISLAVAGLGGFWGTLVTLVVTTVLLSTWIKRGIDTRRLDNIPGLERKSTP